MSEDFMKYAFEEAKLAYSRGDIPVGAALTIDDKLIATAGNSTNTGNNWVSHAEFSLLDGFSGAIKSSRKGLNVVLYTTWEPCLMCAGTALLGRVNKIIYACPDPQGGTSKIDLKYLGNWYEKKWPEFSAGTFNDESYNLLVKFMKEKKVIWGNLLKKLEEDYPIWKQKNIKVD